MKQKNHARNFRRIVNREKMKPADEPKTHEETLRMLLTNDLQ